MKHIHILGICGTFMGSLALLAKEKGFKVTGCDKNVYPPMSTQLEKSGIELIEGFSTDQLQLEPDVYIIGNAISRGNPLMEEILNKGLNFCSGPQWLAQNILHGRWVLGVAGTHGKTTTSSMLTWILHSAGYAPGYLIGGVPNNLGQSASLGQSDFFVIEADEYDSAFFDKRSKFIHYGARTVILNNLEFDHADIFKDLSAIQQQFHHLVKTVPGNGLIIYPGDSSALREVIGMGSWTDTQTIGKDWSYKKVADDGGEFEINFQGQVLGRVQWSLLGDHNVLNAVAAVAAARHVGVEPEIACQALCEFLSVKRRMELLATVEQIKVYDDFAHHPTAIKTTLDGLRASVGKEKIIAVIEPRSNTMKQGVHFESLKPSCASADQILWFEPEGQSWSLSDAPDAADSHVSHRVFHSTQAIIESLTDLNATQNTHIVIMSNGGFEGIHQRIIQSLQPTH